MWSLTFNKGDWGRKGFRLNCFPALPLWVHMYSFTPEETSRKLQCHCLQLAPSQLLELHLVPKQHVSAAAANAPEGLKIVFELLIDSNSFWRGKDLSERPELSEELPRHCVSAYGYLQIKLCPFTTADLLQEVQVGLWGLKGICPGKNNPVQ